MGRQSQLMAPIPGGARWIRAIGHEDAAGARAVAQAELPHRPHQRRHPGRPPPQGRFRNRPPHRRQDAADRLRQLRQAAVGREHISRRCLQGLHHLHRAHAGTLQGPEDTPHVPIHRPLRRHDNQRITCRSAQEDLQRLRTQLPGDLDKDGHVPRVNHARDHSQNITQLRQRKDPEKVRHHQQLGARVRRAWLGSAGGGELRWRDGVHAQAREGGIIIDLGVKSNGRCETWSACVGHSDASSQALPR
mmetsp:Transcript_19620/g.54547  ORF Transcript_19620/g.54547 Transcript_19620/m.54547 type:complete len:247 (-) Transcript_19620:206-946(-)